MLSSLINLFFDAKNNKELDNKYAVLNFETKPYTYKLSTLFKKISNHKFEEGELKVYYGDANIAKHNGNYYIKFKDKFVECEAEVRCTIKSKDIFKVKNSLAKQKSFDNYFNKKVQVFIMGEPYKYEPNNKQNKKTRRTKITKRIKRT